MEGDGEGLVAIVQGLENSGVTLTVCNRSRHSSDTSRPSGLNRIQINAANPRSDMPAVDQRRNMVPAVTAPPAASTAAVQRTSVETSTGSDFSRMATASQICDGRYASSYKLAHCMISPTSPPEAVTEFPPQRKEPCRNHGNFEIGGHSSGQWNGHAIGPNVSAQGCSPVRVQTSRVRHYGGTQTWAEKGSSHRYTKANHRETEAFAHSLRKYPSMAPFRTASTDLIEKLIRYTQAKNYQEASRSTKSLRSLRNQRSSEHDSNRVSTQQQTYTRRRDEDSNLQAGSRGRTRHFKLYSPISDNRHLRESRCRETTYSSSYDYLKAGSPAQGRANRSDGSPSPSRSRSPEKYRSSERSCSPPRTRSPDRSVSPSGSGVIQVERPSRTGRPLRFERSVRDLSLSEMSKYIRSTIRQICNERPVVVQVCPKLKDRYNQHRKVCPNKTESSRDVMEFEEEEDPDQEQRTSEGRRRNPASSDIKGSTAFSTGNINYSLKELIATNKSVRKQWSKHLDDAITKLPLLRKENNDLKDKLAIYDETGQINILSSLSTPKEESNINAPANKLVAPKSALKNNKAKLPPRLSKIEEAFTFSNTTKQKSPFTPRSSKDAGVKDFTSKLKETISTWLNNAQVEIEPNDKNRILEELTKDIIDRQKYLQTFGEKTSQSDNLEYLKLQVHRRLNGLVPIDTLKSIIENTKELVVSVEGVKVPQLVVSPPATKSKKDQPSSKTKNDQTPSKTKINQQKRNTNSQKPSSPTQRKLGPADILGIHSKATNTTSADGVPHTVDDDDGVEDDSDTEFRPGQASTPAKPVDFLDKVTDAVTTWLESMPIDIDPDLRMDVINDLITDIVDRQKYLQVNPDKKFSEEDEIENLRFQVFKRLDKVFESDSSIPPDLVKVEELYKMINGDGQKKTLTAKQAQEFQTALNLEISSILNDYQICCDKRDLLPKLVNELMKLRNSGIDQDEIVENLVDTINRITYLRGDPAEELAYKLLYRTKKLIATIRGDVPVKKRDFKDAVMNDVGDVFQGSSMSESKRRMMENQLAEGYAKDLGIPLEDSYGTMTGQDSEAKKDSYGMSFNGLSNYIDTWLSSIPDDETKDEDEIMDMKKQRMYCLMHKIGEMNVDPEIFNDDSLYEAVLREEIQHLFGDVSANDEEFKALKEDLIEKVLEAQRRAHDELAGQNYKNNLRDTISKLLPDQRNLSKEDKATMETLKDQLADAYIDLHYSGDNEYQRDKLKRKISNEINTFCRDYLNRNPCSPLNSQKLNRDLYAALSKVPLPPGDSIRYEVEQARIREEINDWVKELPLQPQSPTELLARNKLIYVLSKKLFDIEVDEQEEDPDNDMMRKKIVTFLNKLPLESDEDNETIADRLIDKLKSSEESRKYNASSNVTIDASGKVSAANSDSGMSPICPGYKPLLDRRKPCVFPKLCKRAPPKQSEAFPPCTLSPEDRDHLDRIRRRTCLSPNCVTSLMRKNKCPFGLGSPATNMGSQTVLKPFSIEDQQQNRICPFSNRPCPRASANLPHQPCPPVRTEAFQTEKTQPSTLCPAAFEKMPRTCPAGPMRSSQPCQGRRPTLSSSNVSDCTEEVQPQIVIKQYYWDPLNKNSIDLSTEEAQQTGRCNRRSDSITGHSPPRATPCTSPRPTSCRPPPCPPPRPAPCTTSRPPPCKPPPCYSSRPPTCHSSLPCETRTTCPQPAPGPCRRPSSGKQPTACSRPKSPRQNSSERYSFFDPLNSFQRSSHIINSRSPCTPSPCMSPFGINQCPPPGSLGFSKRFNECRMPKRDGLQEQVPSDTSRPSQKERVIELGSLDDVGSRPKKRHSDQSDWPKFHEDDNFWAAPMRRVILDEGIDESLVMERERREERVTCKCKERLVPKCSRPPPGTIPNPPGSQSSEEGQNLKRCSKCCGIHCPYPSFLYFRQ